MRTACAAGVLEATRTLVALDTVSDRSNLALLEQVERWLRASSPRWCFERRCYTGRSGAEQANLIARLPGRHDAPGFVLSGHADTVPWRAGTRAVCAAEQQGGRLWGRGTADMKGAIAAMVVAAGAVARRARLALPLTLVVTAEEEIGCLGAKRLLHERALSGRMAWIGEPTSLRPIRMHKGYLGAEIAVRGSPCHSSRPALGRSALQPAARIALALDALARRLEREGLSQAPEAGDPALWDPPCATLNVGTFRAGTARNVVPGHAELTVEIRPLPGQDLAALQRQVEEVVAQAAGRETRVELNWRTADPPLCTPAESEAVRLAEQLTGERAAAVCFSTEGKELHALGLPTVICGPGSIDVAHTDEEWVALDELEAAVELYRRAIEAVCG